MKNGNLQLFWVSASLFVLKKKWEIFSSIHMITLQNISLKFCQKTDVVISAVTIVCDSQGSTQHQQKVSICDRKQRKASFEPYTTCVTLWTVADEADLKRGLGLPFSDLNAPPPQPHRRNFLLKTSRQFEVKKKTCQISVYVKCDLIFV